jgi:hypothetical protein
VGLLSPLLHLPLITTTTTGKLTLTVMAEQDRIRWRIRWRSPFFVMLAALFAGVAFALGHHSFYNRLDGEEIPAGDYTMGKYNSGITKQQTNAAIGTGLAFAVRTCYVFAVGTAYVQLFWKSLRESSSKLLDLQSIDMAYSAPRNAILLFKPSGWRRFPVLFTLVVTTW